MIIIVLERDRSGRERENKSNTQNGKEEEGKRNDPFS